MNNFNISKINSFHSIVFQYFLYNKLNKKKSFLINSNLFFSSNNIY